MNRIKKNHVNPVDPVGRFWPSCYLFNAEIVWATFQLAGTMEITQAQYDEMVYAILSARKR